ncbi:hypothetical protein AHIS1636_34060 [Arthrobacter mangrovi]|uniref:EcsC family protein n=2 Tax=Arthrobacter mangrovi TaxID=2966350 RepID=A0ABQ5MYD1_9MICC|nr:hypothetical protein AHIS1636_34060 [Arthrobacter mangrovi]
MGSPEGDQTSVIAGDILDKAIAKASSLSIKRVNQLRRKYPEATEADLIHILDKDFKAALTGQGAAVGSTAAIPGFGTAAGLAVAGGEAVLTLNVTAFYVLALAEVHGVTFEDVERKRTLLLTVLLGNGANQAAAKVAGRTGKHWSNKLVQKVPLKAIKAINGVMGRNFVTRYGTKQGIIVLGKVIPFGVGIAIGSGMNYALAVGLVKSAHHAFGDPYNFDSDAEDTLIDAEVIDTDDDLVGEKQTATPGDNL